MQNRINVLYEEIQSETEFNSIGAMIFIDCLRLMDELTDCIVW